RNGGPTEATARDDQDTYSLRPGQVARRADEWEGGIVTSPSSRSSCMHVESVCTYALHSLPADEAIALEAHLTACAECRRELKSFQPVIDSLVGWPTDILRPTPQLWGRLAQRIADETGAKPFLPRTSSYREPAWEEVASGIFCKILASDAERSRV